MHIDDIHELTPNFVPIWDVCTRVNTVIIYAKCCLGMNFLPKSGTLRALVSIGYDRMSSFPKLHFGFGNENLVQQIAALFVYKFCVWEVRCLAKLTNLVFKTWQGSPLLTCSSSVHSHKVLTQGCQVGFPTWQVEEDKLTMVYFCEFGWECNFTISAAPKLWHLAAAVGSTVQSHYYAYFWGWSFCHGRTFLKTWEKNCLLKVFSNLFIALLCFMLKSVINSIEIDKSLIDVFCY